MTLFYRVGGIKLDLMLFHCNGVDNSRLLVVTDFFS
jgi:hypothetical protein